MSVRCPKHKIDLTVEYSSLNILGKEYPVKIGHCAECKVKYWAGMKMTSTGVLRINSQTYEYLNELEFADPQRIEPANSSESTSKPASNILTSSQGDITSTVKTDPQQVLAPKKKKKNKNSEGKERGCVVHVHKLSYPSIVPQTCAKDGRVLEYSSRVMIDLGELAIKISAWYCPKCKTAYIAEEDRSAVKEKIRQASLQQSDAEIYSGYRIPQSFSPGVPVNLAISSNTLYICKGLISCKRNGHSVESATGILLGRNGKTVQLNVNYCCQCQKYFISYAEYLHYRKLYGTLLGNLKMEKALTSQNDFDLAEESILHLCGYSVSQAANLTAHARREILQYLIDSKVSSKAEIINYLNNFIGINGKKQNMGEAVRHWSEDLSWVRDYKINSQHQFQIQNIRKIR